MNDVLNEQLAMMDEYYDRMLNCISTNGRKHNFEKMLDIYYSNEIELSKHWKLNENAHNYCNRFIKDERFSCKYMKNEQLEKVSYDSGVYLIGSVHINPIDKQTYHWVKIGQAKHLHERLCDYMTHNPMMWLIDTKLIDYDVIDKVETHYHTLLDKISSTKGYKSREWWMVSRETYLDICDNKFNYFNE